MKHKESDRNPLKLFQRREIQSGANIEVQKSLQINLPFAQRLGLQNELEGHTGCVNCLQWSDCGEYLASGSDDFNIIVWDTVRQQQKTVIQTGHDGNIFAVKFLPASNNNILASGAADACIKIHDATAEQTIQNFTCHLRRVKRLAVSKQSPFILWSASEDGSVREFDLRTPHKCSPLTPCRNVLVDLRAQSGPSKEVKCVQLHPYFPELIAVGATDPYVRLYDRRMLCLKDFNVNSRDSKEEPSSNKGCVSYFAPGHFPSRRNRTRPQKFKHYTTTYVSFSPDGTELLQNLGGEHIYMYRLNEKRKPLVFTAPELQHDPHECERQPLLRNGANQNRLTEQQKNGCTAKNGYTTNALTTTYDMRKRQGHVINGERTLNDSRFIELPEKAMAFKQKGNDYFSQHNYFQAVVCYNEALKMAPYSSVLYANRGAALLKRAWDGDIYAALRDCQVSVRLDPTHSKAYYRQARCLYELKWYDEAKMCLQEFKDNFFDQADGYSLQKLEMELEQQMKSGSDADIDSDESSSSSESNDSETRQRSPSREEKDRQLDSHDYDLRFIGACNTTTDIKEANYFGDNGQFIIAGSDCGCMLLWDRSTTNLIEAWQGDESIVNCLQPHPTTCLVATSGLDPVVRLWSPRPLDDGVADSRAKEVEVLARTNQKRMNTDPLEEMLRTMGYRAVDRGDDNDDEEDGGDGNSNAMQCRTS